MHDDNRDTSRQTPEMSISYTPTAADLAARVAPTGTWADDVAVIPYVARVWLMRSFDLGPGTPDLFLTELVDPPVLECGVEGVPLRSVGRTPERALHRLEKRLVQRTAKPAEIREVLADADEDERCRAAAMDARVHRSISLRGPRAVRLYN